MSDAHSRVIEQFAADVLDVVEQLTGGFEGAPVTDVYDMYLRYIPEDFICEPVFQERLLLAAERKLLLLKREQVGDIEMSLALIMPDS